MQWPAVFLPRRLRSVYSVVHKKEVMGMMVMIISSGVLLVAAAIAGYVLSGSVQDPESHGGYNF